MRNIRIQRLTLENFKCHKRLDLMLDSNSATIYGDNATGKTSIYDALTWLLFGKDSHGNGEKNIDIKPLDESGAVRDHQAITYVEAVLDVDGAPITLKRTYREVWSAKRGSSQETFDGNTSEYFVDGVPCKKFAFDAKTAELIPEHVFRLLTSISYFPADLDWWKRRNVLFDLAGVHTDREIMATDPRFAGLPERLGKLPLEDHKKKLQAERKGLVGLRTDIPARISENQSQIESLSKVDYDALRQEQEEATAERARLERELAKAKNNGLLSAKQNQLDAAKNELAALELENKSYRLNQETPDGSGKLRAELDRARLILRTCESALQSKQGDIDRLEQEIERHRKDWNDYNAMVFGGATCPTCGQALTGKALDKARRDHEARQEAGKAEAVARSQQAKEQLAACRNEAEKLGLRKAEQEEAIGSLEAQLQAASANSKPEVADMPDYLTRRRDLQEQVDALSNQVFGLQTDSAAATGKLQKDIRSMDARLSALNQELAKESLVTVLETRVQELRQQAAEAAEQLEALNSQIYLLEEYTRYKTRYIEDSINNQFRLARFRLFREQANGGVEERCDVTYLGVPFQSLNSGARINVGIDIINTLSRHYGFRVPLFLDNAESVTKLEQAQTQAIRLVVSEIDQEVRCEYAD